QGDPADSCNHAHGHRRRYGKSRLKHPACQCVAHDEGSQGAIVPDQRAPEQEAPDDRDQHNACDLELWGDANALLIIANPASTRTRASPTWVSLRWRCSSGTLAGCPRWYDTSTVLPCPGI